MLNVVGIEIGQLDLAVQPTLRGCLRSAGSCSSGWNRVPPKLGAEVMLVEARTFPLAV
jgi:hypothetical protein